MTWQTWSLYALAAIGLSLTPGPNGLLALTHGALHGTKKTLATIVGGSLGFGLIIGLSMFGIGALLATWAGLLVIMKWLGGAYLVWLGIQLIRSEPIDISRSKNAGNGRFRTLFRQGFISAVSNPKGILFFVAFLPQFVNPQESLFTQFLLMAITFMVIEFVYEFTVASLADRIKPLLVRAGKNFNRVFGGVFIAIGVLLPLRG
ncbi:LysE family translocator [Aquiluna sp. Uisw_065]|jgi:homoserine/homoserine lactone efflux protein|uniref:LysE family translocator n=1 Tax=Aquiluna sp. Uisw_065 TaxID=3230967 RepID=UPI0035916407